MSVLWWPINVLQIVLVSLWSAGCIAVAIVASKVARSPRPGLWMARKVWAPVTLVFAGARLDGRSDDHVVLPAHPRIFPQDQAFDRIHRFQSNTASV